MVSRRRGRFRTHHGGGGGFGGGGDVGSPFGRGGAGPFVLFMLVF
jgi:hypothetical protein